MARKLTHSEIETLEKRGCTATDWSCVEVAEGFSADRLTSVNFSGAVRLGVFDKTVTNEVGITRQTGISYATLHDCSVGDNCLITNIQNYIAAYDIEENCVIENVNSISCEPGSRFGNGVRVAVLSETGGREVAIFNTLSSHLAYILAIYRYKQPVIQSIERLIDNYCEAQRSDRGTIGAHSVIRNAGTIRSVKIAAHTIIDGAAELVDGSINSTAEAPVRVGVGVMAHHFIFSSGVIVDTAASLHNCFIGQGSVVRNLFSAHDSLIFSNCQFENGEACAIFAGPYTVSMHKSSLLIAGLYSFLNAGSGSNQSNHMYKLGPIHQGVVERGSKTTSDSYILWPAHIGAFSLVMGRHTSHPNTRDMPFSYLIERGDKTHLSPGVNLKSVGTIRDTIKWPKRDRRTGCERLDHINFNLLSPFTVSRMMRGVATLEDLKNLSGATSSEYAYQSTRISSSALMRGISLYGKAIDKFLGNSLLKRLESITSSNEQELRKALAFDKNSPLQGDWIDLSGLIASSADVEAIFADIAQGVTADLQEVERRFAELHSLYYEKEWQWAASAIERWYGVEIEKITADQVMKIAQRWIDSVVSIDRMLAEDAHKEFSLVSRVGFGVDGSATDATADFEAVRGSAENNDFIRTINDHIARKQTLFDNLQKRLKK